MSKMGAYVIDQIERGNYTVDRYGVYHIDMKVTKELIDALKKEQDEIREDAIQKEED